MSGWFQQKTEQVQKCKECHKELKGELVHCFECGKKFIEIVQRHLCGQMEVVCVGDVIMPSGCF